MEFQMYSRNTSSGLGRDNVKDSTPKEGFDHGGSVISGKNGIVDLNGLHQTDVISVQDRSVLRAVCQESGVSACISPTDGAELCSLVFGDSSESHELLYRGNDWTPISGWPGRAPWLWPVAGRTYSRFGEGGGPLPESINSWECGGLVLPIVHHGFARFRQWSASTPTCDAGAATVSARLDSTLEDRDSFPYDYCLETIASVSGSVATLSMSVSAGTGNHGPMPFTIGQHLTFDFSSWWGGDWLQGSLCGAGSLGWGVDGHNMAGDPVRFTTQPIPLTDPLLANALIPAVPGKPVELVSLDKKKKMTLSLNASSLPSRDAALWVVHRDTQGRYFCLEPWVGWPNGLNTGRGRVLVNPGDTWQMSLRIDMTTNADQQDAQDTVPNRVVHINPAVVDSMLERRPAATPRNERVTEDR